MKKTVCILFGGKSTEYEISLISASFVIENIDREKYNPVLLGITREGKWLLYRGGIEAIKADTWMQGDVHSAVLSPDCTQRCIINLDTLEKIKIDIAFPVIHGAYGEDGALQGLFSLAGIPFVGPGVCASSICMDKWYSKILFEAVGIPQARCEMKTQQELVENRDCVLKCEQSLGYPIFVKPANTGSSVGVNKAHDRAELFAATEEALLYDDKVIFEESIDCRELETAVLGNDELQVAVVGEVIPGKEFYDYEAKYQDDSLQILIPAPVEEDVAQQIRRYAAMAYRAAGCKGLSRIDFFLDKKTGRVLLNEINTIPGFTGVSMYPMLFKACGLDGTALVSCLLEAASL